jgi:asparagine synthase (glutamine-hydrolysing)
MCGIAAVFAYGQAAAPVDRAEVLRMREQMFSRGPDGDGEWFSDDGRVGFGHRRLSIIDLSPAGAQPMWNADRSLGIIFNGEIYNYAELRSELAAKGYQFRSHCDTEVLLALYETRGENMFEKVRGMYAFAIWDARRHGVFMARDPFGIKPLYYSDDGQTFRIASQVKPLRDSGKIDLAPEPAGHVGYFLWGHVPDPYTMYRGIRSLPAGSTMWIDRHGTRGPNEFCSISSILRGAEKLKTETLKSGNPDNRERITDNSEQVATRLRSALAETVRYHMVADVPVGVFLSSGLDSTAIAALAAEQGGILRTVTLGFEEYKWTDADETPLAEQFAQRCGAQHQTIWVSRGDFEAYRDHLFDAMDRPSTDGVNTFFVSLAAKQANLKVALSGLGGDELFATYPSFHDVPRSVRLLQPFSGLLGVFGRNLRILSAPVLKRFTSPKYAGMFEYGGTYSGAYLLRRGMFMPWELPEFLDPDFVREGWRELQTLVRLDETTEGLTNPRLKVSALEMEWYMRHQLLRDSDWAGMGHSLEIRVPFVDVDLLRSIAPLLASESAPSKREMAAAASPLVTPELLERPKTGFQIPVREWLMTDVQPATIHAQRHGGMRGLRGWAKHVYRHFPGAQLQENVGRRKIGDRRSKIGGERTEDRGQRPDVSSPLSVVNGHLSHLPSPISHLPIGQSAKRILVFRIGQLGDTLVSLPAMQVVRHNFPDAHIALLSDRHPGRSYVLAPDLLRGAGIFDEFLSYPVSDVGEVLRGTRMFALLTKLRGKRFDTLVYLAPSNRWPEQIARDHRFFALAGIKNFIGMEAFATLEPKRDGEPLREVPRESELLLRRLAASGLTVAAGVSPTGSRTEHGGQRSEVEDRMSAAGTAASTIFPDNGATITDNARTNSLALAAQDERPFHDWLGERGPDGGRVWVAVGPGSKMPAKRWPLLRFEEVVVDLIEEFDIWPVVFGGSEDAVIGDWLLNKWGRGYNAAGSLGIRPSLVALQKCALFLGNDTGTMHMAAAVGVPCVAIFSARERPGLWYPAGEGHRVFRSTIECEGCALIECIERANECLKNIAVSDVTQACRAILAANEKVRGEP